MKSIDVKVTDLILPLRSVCKRWRNEVDRLCGDQLVKCYSDISHLVSPDFYLNEISISGKKDLRRLMKCYGINKDNLRGHDHRIVRRSMLITTGDFGKKYYKRITQLLSIIGPKIWDFTINFNGPRRSYSKPEEILVKWVTLLPNLRYLNVWWWQPDLTPSEKEEAKWSWKKNPFPVLKYLERVCFNENHDRRFPFANQLLKPNKNLKKLVLDLNQLRMCLEFAHQVNLESLCISFDDFDEEPTVANLQPVLNYDWPLKCFDIGYGGQFRSDELFPLLEKFKATLELVTLQIFLIDNKVKLDLPKLKKVMLILDQDCDNIDFLLECKNLEDLTLSLSLHKAEFGYVNDDLADYFDTEDEGEVVKVKGYLNDFYDSNAWELFPVLKDVLIEFNDGEEKYYTRSEWEA